MEEENGGPAGRGSARGTGGTGSARGIRGAGVAGDACGAGVIREIRRDETCQPAPSPAHLDRDRRVRAQEQSFTTIDIKDGCVTVIVNHWAGEAYEAADAQRYEYQGGRWRILKAEEPAH